MLNGAPPRDAATAGGRLIAIQYLDLIDYLLIAEAVTGTEALVLADLPRVSDLASSALMVPQSGWAGIEAYPDFADKIALLGSRLTRNHPLPDNKRTAFLAMNEFADRNGYQLEVSDAEENKRVMNAVASGGMTENEFAESISAPTRARD